MKQSPLINKEEDNRHPFFKDQIISNKQKQLPLQPQKVIRNSTSNYQTELHKFYDSKINYDMLSEDKNPRKTRSFRQDINHVKYKDYSHEFIAYCLINKESNSGIFSHERLLVLDSYLQELRYYSIIPHLPLINIEQLSSIPKETIKLSKVGKFSFIPVKNGIGEVIISWKEGATIKEWKISMGNRRIAKEFSILIEEVRKKEHLLKSEIKMFESRLFAQENKVNLKTTPFIEQVIKLDQKQEQNVNKSKASDIKTDEKGEIELKSLGSKQIKQQHKITAVEKEKKIQQNDGGVLKPLTFQPVESASQNLLKQTRNKNQTQPKSYKLEQKEIKIQQIIKNAEIQHQHHLEKKASPSDALEINKDHINNQRLSQLQRILKSRRQELENSDQPTTPFLKPEPQQDISMSKVLIRHTLSSSPPKPQSSTTNQLTVQLSPKRYLSQNEENSNIYRLSLLQQRRQSYQSYAKKIVINHHKHPIRESRGTSKEASTTSRVERQHGWLYKWITAKNYAQKAQIYSKFVNHCQAKVLKIVDKFQNWHLFHKHPQQYHLQEQEVQYSYEMKTKHPIKDSQESYLQNISNFNYLMTAIDNFRKVNNNNYSSSNNILFAVPMTCLVNYKCLMVFCKASQTSTKISVKNIDKNKYLKQICNLQKYAKVPLQNCQILQLQSNQQTWLYFKQLSVLPFLNDDKSIYIDGHYLSRYIKDGIIKNSYDIQAINNHLETIIPSLLKALEQSHPLTTIELEQIINSFGLNLSFVIALYQHAVKIEMTKAASILISQMMSTILGTYIRTNIHSQLMKKNTDKTNFIMWIYPLIFQYLNKSKSIPDTSRNNLAELLNEKNIHFTDNAIINEYVIASLLLKLGLRCEVKVKMSIQLLQNMQFQFWNFFQFCPQNINLVPVSEAICYHIQHFSQSWFSFITNDFGKDEFVAEPTQKQALLNLINIHPNRPYQQSPIFQLMPNHHKIKLNFLLALHNAPLSTNEGLSFLSQFNDPYFNLCHHSTAYIPTYYSFASDLAGLKWLIKKKQYQQVQAKMKEQMQRIWIWAHNNPKILIQIYDLNALFYLMNKKAADGMASSLKSLQVAIYFFGKGSNNIWLIWQKAYNAAKIHYDLNKIQQALELYCTCVQLIEKMPETKIKECGINKQFLDIYLRKVKLLLNLGQVQDAIDTCKSNLLKYKHWKSIFDSTSTQILHKIFDEEFETYLLQFRCYQIQNQTVSLIELANFCCKTYIEEHFSQDSLSSYYCIETLKIMWTAIVTNAHASIDYNHYMYRYNPDFHKMDFASLETYLGTHQINENLNNQMFKYIEIAIQKNYQIQKGINQISVLVKLTLQSLNSISKSKFSYQPSVLNSEKIKQNHLLFIKFLMRLIGQEFALGYIESNVSQCVRQ